MSDNLYDVLKNPQAFDYAIVCRCCRCARHADEVIQRFAKDEAALQSRLAASEADAERYRAKRHAAWESHTREQSAVQNTPQLQSAFYASYDAAIDAARAGEGT